MNLDGAPQFDYFRERKIELEDKPVAPLKGNAPSVTSGMVTAMYDNMRKVVGKADRLLDELKRTAPLRIPVHDRADEVRLALRSLYPGQPEDFITYNQYLECLEAEDRFFNFDPTTMIDLMTGDSIVDSRILSQSMQEAYSGKPMEELLLMGGHFAAMLLCNRMLQVFQAPNTQSAVAGKMPPGTETAATLMQVLIGLSAILLQTAISEKEAAKSLENTFGEFLTQTGMSADSIIAQAKETPPDSALQNYTLSRESEHRAAIKDYSNSYVMNNPGYDSWVATEDVRGIKSDLVTSIKEERNYASGVYNMGKEIYRVSVCGLDRSNDSINKIAAVLSHRYTRDMLCCFARFVTAIPTDVLKIWRAGLAMAARGISLDLNATVNNFTNSLNAKLERMFLEPVMHMLDNFFREMRTKALSMLDPNSHGDPEAFNNLLLCTPIDEMFTYILSAIEKLQAFVVKYIRRYWELGKIKHVKGSLKVQVLADNKKAAALLKILDAVIQSLDAANICAQEDSRTPSSEDMDEILRRTQLDLPSPINIDTGDDPYASFNLSDLEDFKSSQGLPILKAITGDTAEHGLQDCARARISDKNMAEFIARASKVSEDMANANLE